MISRALRNILVIETLLAMAGTMVSPFISIYLFRSELGYISIAGYYGLCFAMCVLYCIIFSYFPVTNARLSISLSMGVLILNYLSIFFVPSPWLFIISPALFALYVMWFWLPFNFIICQLTSKGDRGTTLGIMFLLFPILQLITPLAAGLLISVYGYSPLFLVATAILAVNIFLPYFLLKGRVGRVTEKARLDFKPFGTRLSAGLLLQGMQDGVFFFLIPLVSFSITGGEFGVGLAMSLFAVGGGVGAVVVARISDRSGDRVTWFRIGALACVPLFLLVWAFPTLYVFMVCIGVAQFSMYTVTIFIMTMAVDRNEMHKPTALLSREFLLEMGRALGVVAIAVIWMASYNLFLGFIVAALCVGASAVVK